MSTTRDWDWAVADTFDDLKTDEPHVWLVELSGGAFDRDGCWPLLSDREKKRAERYTHPGAHDEYVVSRAMLRVLLAGYVGVDPLDLSFRTAPGGKPFLNAIEGMPRPEFNMTHSHGVGLFAFAIDQEVGVDVEYVERKTDAEGVARRFFTERESERICERPEKLREAFVRTWTCKEACLKWTGKGLKGGLKTHEILFSDSWSEPLAVGDGHQPHLTMLDPGDGWVGALAVSRPPSAVTCGVWKRT